MKRGTAAAAEEGVGAVSTLVILDTNVFLFFIHAKMAIHTVGTARRRFSRDKIYDKLMYFRFVIT